MVLGFILYKYACTHTCKADPDMYTCVHLICTCMHTKCVHEYICACMPYIHYYKPVNMITKRAGNSTALYKGFNCSFKWLQQQTSKGSGVEVDRIAASEKKDGDEKKEGSGKTLGNVGLCLDQYRKQVSYTYPTTLLQWQSSLFHPIMYLSVALLMLWTVYKSVF